MAFLMVCLFLVPAFPMDIKAKDTFLADYLQTVYNQNNGIGNNEVNCLLQSSSGYIWIGTDGGLYRYNGSEFVTINLWDMDKSDVYSIKCIMQDSTGRLWIGTGNYGLFYLKDGEYIHLENEYYDGIKTINDICETDEGVIYVATANGLYNIVDNDSGSISMVQFSEDSLSNQEFIRLAYMNTKIYAATENTELYIFNENGNYDLFDTYDITGGDDIRCLEVINSRLYIGTSGRNIIRLRENGSYDTLTAEVDGINSIMYDHNGYKWVCADNGLGFFNNNNTFVRLNECEIDSYLSDIIEDYEGNYWIASTRMGTLLLSNSKFVNYNMYSGLQETMVNSVYVYNNNTYICTDDGLIIYDKDNSRVSNDLTDSLENISVKHIAADSSGNLWISTYRRFGLIKYETDGTVTNITRAAGLLNNSINCSRILKNGNIAVATIEGISIINRDCKVLYSYGKNDGMQFNNVLCIYQDDDGKIYAGTDGGGMYIFTPELKLIEKYTTETGLNSDFVTSIESGEKGIWIGTDNGLGFYNDTYRSISNIEYSNSIYDILLKDDFVWLVSSMGILRTTEEELLGAQGISLRYLDSDDGLNKTINVYSNSFIDDNGVLYVCCNTGICSLDTKNIPYNQIAPKIRVTAVDVDEQRYEFDDLANGLKVDSNVQRITIDFAVFSYINRSDIRIEYYLEGFDEEPIAISGKDTMEAVYTNLDGGIYTFHINAYNGDGTPCENEISFTIEKENNFTENPVSRIAITVIAIAVFILIVVGIIKMRTSIKNKNKELEELSKEHEEVIKTSSAKNDYLANMSNEIKTPINAIMSKADEIMQLMGADDDYKDSVQDIYNIGNGIIEKVDDIILLAKIEGGRIEKIDEPYSLTSLLFELSEYAKEIIDEENVKLFVEFGNDIPDVLIGDKNIISSIIRIFIDNAVKFTKEGSITLSVDAYELDENKDEDGSDNNVRISYSVSDTGIGIQEERLADILEVYNIGDTGKNNIFTGSGIGLAIANGYSKLIGGEISVESMYGAGSTFSLYINEQISDENVADKNVERINDIVSKEIAEKMWLPDVKALIVDDEAVSREVTARTLETFEMKIDMADSGMSALDMVMNNDYDVVFMDLSMPIMNGIDAMKEIRSLEGEKYLLLPIISLDYNAISDNKASRLEDGFTDTMLKPIDLRRVAAILNDCLPENKIKEKSSNIEEYINNSEYHDYLLKLDDYINVKRAIEKIGGSIDVFNKIIKAFYNQNKNLKENIEAHDSTDTHWFKRKIHTLKTSSYNIGAYEFSQETARIEAAINSNNNTYMLINYEKHLSHLDELVNAIGEYINSIDDLKKTKQHEEEEIINSEEIYSEERKSESIDKTLLNKLDESLATNDSKTLNKIMTDILKYNYEGEDGEFIVVLKETIDDNDIEKARELITTYLDLKS
ncbi:MAG: response regulator [Lachnospiraceae bacterium]|nr:response regulator [Lachnospiraceae bacterium]